MSHLLPFIRPDSYDKVSWGFTAMLAVTGAASVVGALLGRTSPQVQYSKFGLRDSGIPSRLGMITLYLPACLLGSWYFYSSNDWYMQVISASIAVHFGKRVFESLFVHRYSGSMAPIAVGGISAMYTATALNVLRTAASTPTSVGLAHLDHWAMLGYVMYGVGMLGNFYHHIILRNLRSDGSKEYKAPQGGFFNLVVCPHYFFELIQFAGMAVLSGQPLHWASVLSTLGYFLDRSAATLKWYKEKIPAFEKKNIKKLIPFLY